MTLNEFSPYERIKRSLSFWWLIALAAILGGALGYAFFQLHPPVYEATATYLVNIDLELFPLQGMKEDLVQYNEDLAVNTTQSVLLSKAVLDQVISQANASGIAMTVDDLLHNYTIERKHETWELRFRHPDAQIARQVVDTWAEIGFQNMQAWQASGKAPSYVNFHPPAPAQTPQEPTYYDRNKVVLAGVLIGFIAGIILSDVISRSSKTVRHKP